MRTSTTSHNISLTKVGDRTRTQDKYNISVYKLEFHQRKTYIT